MTQPPPLPPGGQDEGERAFQEWMRSRPPREDSAPASVEFMAMMREAAARQAEAEAAKAQIRHAAARARQAAQAHDLDAPVPAEAHATAEVSAQGPLVADTRPPRSRAGNGAAAYTPETAPEREADAPRAPKPTARARTAQRAERKAERDAVREAGRDAGRDPERDADDTPRYGRERARRAVSVIGGFTRSAFVVTLSAVLLATVFMWATPNEFIQPGVRSELGAGIATAAFAESAAGGSLPTAAPTPNWARKVGIVSGHRGPQNDPGAVCPDGLTENSINYSVAQRVVDTLQARGYDVVLLDEFDARLDNFQADALVSIHANTCRDFGEPVSGYLIAAAAARITARGNDQVLVDCVSRHYAVATGLQRRDGVTIDMTDYHTFREIHPLTPAAIIELGFMLADREILTERPDDMAAGIIDGILCFIEPGSPQSQFQLPTPTPPPADGATAIPFTPLPTLPPG
jgi:N-acetylmuramoyl-L-alanine amidase